jgi:hypothetical protein
MEGMISTWRARGINVTSAQKEDRMEPCQVKGLVKAVTAGAKWLDKTKPGWEKEIGLAVPTMQDPNSCVLGRVFKKEATESRSGFWWAVDKYSEVLEPADWLDENVSGEKFGFNIDADDDDERWNLLAHLWQNQVLRRMVEPVKKVVKKATRRKK